MKRTIFGLLLIAATIFQSSCVTEPEKPPTSSISDDLSNRFSACDAVASEEQWRSEVLRLVNQERAAAGLQALSGNEILEKEATEYACEMIQNDFFGHVNPVTDERLRDRASKFGYEYHKIGENLAAVPAEDCTPETVMEYWMDSDGHRKNILEPEFTEIGIGIRTGGQYGTYWVQEFGRPAE